MAEVVEKVRERLVMGRDGLRGGEAWRDINEYRVGEILEVKYQGHGVSKKVRGFLGVCIRKERKGVMSSITLRNVIGGVGVELVFYLNGNRIVRVRKAGDSKEIGGRSKLYFLREKALSRSSV